MTTAKDEASRERLEETTRWDPGEVEPRVFARWLEGGWFHPRAEGTPEENFSVAIPPPNVTGVLHMGHALNGSIQDVLVRMRRMQGRNTLWTLGTDHAGIATQAVVEKELRSEGGDRHQVGRDAFVKHVWEWKRDYGSRIVTQYQRLGASCDYDRERFTLDEPYAEAVARVFCELHERGYIYRDEYMVNWDPGSRSAISDLEVENREVTDSLVEIAYPLADGSGELVVATVRPETILGDTAVAVSPDDARYSDLIGSEVVLPLVGRRLPVIADDHVDPEFGTGALKITPGHDPNDFEIGRAHGLDEISVIGEDGRMTEAAGEAFSGMTVAEAREAVVAALGESGALRGESDYLHSVPFSHRSGERIEPLVSLQWFCRMDALAEPAIEAIESGKVKFTPDSAREVCLDWLRKIRPWCVSRQLWWGHRLPVWYRGEEIEVSEQRPDGEGWTQDEDVLDTWFSSALWPYATLGWPDTDSPEFKAFFPTDFLTTAREILFLWVARMIMTSIEFTGRVPFEDVYVHSVIQAPDGRRMSKSLGTGIDPLEQIDAHGADALRFGLLAMSSTQDVRFSEARVQQGRDLANKMWNASRLILTTADLEAVPAPGRERVEDRWIASRLQRTVEAVTEMVEAYDFSHAALTIYEFFWSEFCDWYLEAVKPRLYESDAEASGTLLWALEEVLALVHPFMPFVTEEIYSYLPKGDDAAPAMAVHAFPELDESLIDPSAEGEMSDAVVLTRSLRRWRDLAGVPAGAVLAVRSDEDLHPLVCRLARVEEAVDCGSDEVLASVGAVDVLSSEEIDADAVAARIEERREKLSSEIARAEGKLSNEGFVSSAPSEVVEAERSKLAEYRAELEELAG